MAFLTIEDLVGTLEVIVFPRDYERNRNLLVNEAKVFIVGHANVEEEKNGKLICERLIPFESTKRELWIQFASKEQYAAIENNLYEMLRESEGNDEVVIYISGLKAVKRLPKNWNISVTPDLLKRFYDIFEEKNVKVVEKSIENNSKRY